MPLGADAAPRGSAVPCHHPAFGELPRGIVYHPVSTFSILDNAQNKGQLQRTSKLVSRDCTLKNIFPGERVGLITLLCKALGPDPLMCILQCCGSCCSLAPWGVPSSMEEQAEELGAVVVMRLSL